MGVLLLVRHAQRPSAFRTTTSSPISANCTPGWSPIDSERVLRGSDHRFGHPASAARHGGDHQQSLRNARSSGRPVGRVRPHRHSGRRSAALVFDRQNPADGRARAESTLDQALYRWIAGNSNHLLPDVQSHHDFTTRCLAGLRSMTLRRDTTVVTLSGGVIAVIASALLGLPAEAWPTLSKGHRQQWDHQSRFHTLRHVSRELQRSCTPGARPDSDHLPVARHAADRSPTRVKACRQVAIDRQRADTVLLGWSTPNLEFRLRSDSLLIAR